MIEPVLARDLMTHPVRRITVETPVRDAAEFLVRWGISGAPVVDGRGRPVGVFTLNDLARHVQKGLVERPAIDPLRERAQETGEFIPTGKGLHFEGFDDTRVHELMTPGLVTVFPEATVEEVARSMVSLKIHRVFVISESTDELLGIITSLDVLQWMDREFRAHRAEARRQSI